ncbi:A-kinase anchor protein 9-like isoform X6 [Mytilus californianus]|uniref:A-kinase anchor protein 9-like isoform X6 n=1 Tax=Mytilus californianus TaxID=6549 RepID=UPI002247CB86|nr:A-kinase anchor protein 9-like isoform X6 [Mytilus californianus]
MDEEERNKKLRAGKEKLAAFQKKKSKKKHSHHHHGDETVAAGDSSISSIDQSSSSDVPLFEDSDQNMTSEDETTIQDSKSLFKVQTKLKHATERIAELEESLEGKQLALDRVISENTKLKESDFSQKIAEMEVAMSKRDEIIRQLTTRLQSTASLQTEAEQLTHHVQQLQAQLINAGKLMESQNSKQLMSSQALLEAKHEIEALQKCIEDKDTLLSQLSDKVGAISDEYVNLKASYEASRQKEAESSKVVKSLMSDAEDIRRQGSVNGSVAVSNSDVEDRVQKVRLELEETYGNQIALIKDELSKLYNVEVEKLTGELNNFKEICAKHESDNNSLEEEKQKLTARNTSNDLLISELQSKLTEFNSKCVQIQSEKDELTKESLTLSKQIDLLSSQLESIHHDHPESNGSEPVQEDNNLESYNKITELNERNLNLTSELDTIRKDYANAQKNVEELEKKVKGSRPARFQVDSQEIVMELKQVTEQYEEALVNIALMQGRIEDYDIKCEILNEDLNKMKEQLKRSENAAKTYEEQTKEYENIKEKLSKSEQEIKSFEESVKEYESKHEKVLSELRDMTEQCTNAQTQCEEYRDKFVEYEQQLTDYEGLTTQYNELQHECNVYQTQNDELNNKMNIQQDVVMELKAELEILSNQNQAFQEQSPIQTQQLEDLTKENKSLLESIDLYKDEVTKLTNSLNQATVEVDTYKEKTNSLESLVKTLEDELKSKRDTELMLKQKDDSIKKLTNDIDDLTLQLHMQEPVEESFQKETISHEEASLSLSNSVSNQVVTLNETKDLQNAQIVQSEANSSLSFDCFVQEEIEQQSELALHVVSDMEADSLDGDTVDSIEDSKQSDLIAEISKLQHENINLHDENHELKLTIQNIKVTYGNDLEQALQSCRSEIVNLSAKKTKIETSYAVLEENITKINEKVRLAESALATVEEEKLALQNELIYINSMVDDMSLNEGLSQSDSNTSLTVCNKLKTLQEKLEIAQSNTENLSSQSEKLKTEKLENIEIHKNVLLHKQEENDNLCKQVECLQIQMKNMETEVEKSKQLLKENYSLSISLQEMNEREQNLRIQCERLSQQIFELSVINQTVSGDKENLENRFVEVSAMENTEISDSVVDSHVNEVMSSKKSHDLLLTNQQLLPISEHDNDVKCAVTADGETLVRDAEPKKTTDLLVHEGEISQQSTANQLTTLEKLKTQYESQLNSFRQELDSERQARTEKMECTQSSEDKMEKLDTAEKEKLDEIISVMNTQHSSEIESLQQRYLEDVDLKVKAMRITLEQIYSGQLDLVKTELEKTHVQSLKELNDQLTKEHEEDIQKIERLWEKRLEDVEEQHEEEMNKSLLEDSLIVQTVEFEVPHGAKDSTSVQIQKTIKKMAEEHGKLLQKISDGLSKSPKIRTPRKIKQSQGQQTDDDTDTESIRSMPVTEEEYQQLEEKEKIVETAEDVRQTLESQREELDLLRASLLQEYEQLLAARTDRMSDEAQEVERLQEEMEQLQKLYNKQKAKFQSGGPQITDLSSLKKQYENKISSLEKFHQEEILQYKEEIEKFKGNQQDVTSPKRDSGSDAVTSSGVPDEQETERDYLKSAYNLTVISDDSLQFEDDTNNKTLQELKTLLAKKEDEISDLQLKISQEKIENQEMQFKLTENSDKIQELENKLRVTQSELDDVNSLMSDKDCKIESLMKQKQALGEKCLRELEECENKHAKIVNEISEKFEKVFTDLKSSQAEVSKLKADLEASQEQERMLEEQYDELQQQQKAAMKNLQERSEHDNEEVISEMKLTHEKEMETLREKHKEELDSLSEKQKEDHETLKQELENVHQEQIEELQHQQREKNESLCQDLEHESQVELVTIQTEFKVQMEVELKRQAADITAGHEKDIRKLKEDYEQKIDDLKYQIQSEMTKDPEKSNDTKTKDQVIEEVIQEVIEDKIEKAFSPAEEKAAVMEDEESLVSRDSDTQSQETVIEVSKSEEDTVKERKKSLGETDKTEADGDSLEDDKDTKDNTLSESLLQTDQSQDFDMIDSSQDFDQTASSRDFTQTASTFSASSSDSSEKGLLPAGKTHDNTVAVLMQEIGRAKEETVKQLQEEYHTEINQLNEKLKEAIEKNSKQEENFKDEKDQIIEDYDKQIKELEEHRTASKEEIEKQNRLKRELIKEHEDNVSKLHKEYDEKMELLRQELVETFDSEKEELKKQHELDLNEADEKYETLIDRIKSGEAPEVADIIHERYDTELEMAKTLMQQEFDETIESEQARFMEQHQELMDKVTAERQAEAEELRMQHEKDISECRKTLIDEYDARISELEQNQEIEISKLKEELTKIAFKPDDIPAIKSEESTEKTDQELEKEEQTREQDLPSDQELEKEEQTREPDLPSDPEVARRRSSEEKDNSIEDLRDTHTAIIARIEAEYEEKLKRIKEEIASTHSTHSDDLDGGSVDTVTSRKSAEQHKQDLMALEQQMSEKHQKEIHNIQTQHQSRIEEMEDKYKKEIGNLKKILEFLQHSSSSEDTIQGQLISPAQTVPMLESLEEEIVPEDSGRYVPSRSTPRDDMESSIERVEVTQKVRRPQQISPRDKKEIPDETDEEPLIQFDKSKEENQEEDMGSEISEEPILPDSAPPRQLSASTFDFNAGLDFKPDFEEEDEDYDRSGSLQDREDSGSGRSTPEDLMQTRALADTLANLKPVSTYESGELPVAAEVVKQKDSKIKDLEDEIKKLQQRLQDQIEEERLILMRREKESQEDQNLELMLKSDLERVNTDRESVQRTNEQLLQLLSDSVKTYLNVEDSINKKLVKMVTEGDKSTGSKGRSPPRDQQRSPPLGAEGGAEGDGDSLQETSILSNVTDEGLDLSQRISESIFQGPELDKEGEELLRDFWTMKSYLRDASHRLQNSVSRLLEMIEETTNQLLEARNTQHELVDHVNIKEEDSNQMNNQVQDLQEQLRQEIKAKEYLAVELHKAEGLIEGYSSERETLNQQIADLEEKKEALVLELETTKNKLQDLESIHHEAVSLRSELQRQQSLIQGNVGEEAQALLLEVNRLNDDKRDLQQQVRELQDKYEGRVRDLQNAGEETERHYLQILEDKKAEIVEMQLKVDAVEKQLKYNKQFLESTSTNSEQTIEREQEQEEFQREINKWKQESLNKDKLNKTEGRLQKEVDDLTEELEDRMNSHSEIVLQTEKLQRDLREKKLTTEELNILVRQLELEIEDKNIKENQLKQKIVTLEEELQKRDEMEEDSGTESPPPGEEVDTDIDGTRQPRGHRRRRFLPSHQVSVKQEEELIHEKEELQKQVEDYMKQMSALEIQMDEMRHRGDYGGDTQNSTLQRQLEREKELLEEKEIKVSQLQVQIEDLEDQLNNKEQHIQQLTSQGRKVPIEEVTSQYDDRVSQLERENESLMEKVKSLQSQFPSEVSPFTQTLIDEKNQEIDHLNDQVHQLQEDLNKLSSGEEIVNLRDQVERLQGELDRKNFDFIRASHTSDGSFTDSEMPGVSASFAEKTSLQQEIDDSVANQIDQIGNLQQEVEQLKSSLTQREEQITSLKTELEIKVEPPPKTEDAVLLNDVLQEKEAYIDQLNIQVEGLNNEVESLHDFQTKFQEDYDMVQAMLEEKVKEIEDKEREIDLLTQELTQKPSDDESVVKLELDLARMRRDLAEKDNIIEEKAEEMYMLNEKVEQQEATLEEMKELQNRIVELENENQKLQSLESEEQETKKLLEEKEAEIDQIKEESVQKESKMAKMQDELDAVSEHLKIAENLQRKLEEAGMLGPNILLRDKDEEIQKLKKDIAELREKLDSYAESDEQMLKNKKEISKLKEELAALRVQVREDRTEELRISHEQIGALRQKLKSADNQEGVNILTEEINKLRKSMRPEDVAKVMNEKDEKIEALKCQSALLQHQLHMAYSQEDMDAKEDTIQALQMELAVLQHSSEQEVKTRQLEAEPISSLERQRQPGVGVESQQLMFAVNTQAPMRLVEEEGITAEVVTGVQGVPETARQQIEARDLEITRLREELSYFKESYDSGSRIEEHDVVLQEKEEKISDLTAKIEIRDDQLRTKHEVIEQLKSDMDNVQHHLASVRAEEENILHAKSEEVKSLQSQLVSFESKIDEYANIKDKLDQYESDLNEKENQIQDLDEDCSRLREKLKQQEYKLQTAASFENIETELREKDNLIQDLEEECSMLRKKLKDQENKIQVELQKAGSFDAGDDVFAQLQEKQEKLEQTSRELSTTFSKLKNSEEKLEQMTDVKQRLKEAVELSEQQLHIVEQKDQEYTKLKLDIQEMLSDKDKTIKELKQELQQVTLAKDQELQYITQEVENDKMEKVRVIENLQQQVRQLQTDPSGGGGDAVSSVTKLQVQLQENESIMMEMHSELESVKANLEDKTQQLEVKMIELEQARGQISDDQVEIEAATQGQLDQLRQELHIAKTALDEMQREGGWRNSRETSIERDGLQYRSEHLESDDELEGMDRLELMKEIKELRKDLKTALSELDLFRTTVSMSAKDYVRKVMELREELSQQHHKHIQTMQDRTRQDSETNLAQLRIKYEDEIEYLKQLHKTELEKKTGEVKRELEREHDQEIDRLMAKHQKEIEIARLQEPVLSDTMTMEAGRRLQSEISLSEKLDNRLLQSLQRQPEGASGTDNTDVSTGVSSTEMTNDENVSSKLQMLMNRLHREGVQMLSISELQFLNRHMSPSQIDKEVDVESLKTSWESEKQSLLSAIQSLKDLLAQTHKLRGLEKGPDVSDWRGELLQAISYVFAKERDTLLAELRSHVLSHPTTDLSEIQNLEQKIRNQEEHQKSSLDQIFKADRQSMLAEIRDLRAHTNISMMKHQEEREKMSEQLSTIEDQTTKKERQAKRQAQLLEYKLQQEKILQDDVRSRYDMECERNSELSTLLSREKNHNLDLQTETSNLQAQISKLKDALEREQSRFVSVSEMWDSLVGALDEEKGKSHYLSELLDAERFKFNNIQVQLEDYRVNSETTQPETVVEALKKEVMMERDRRIHAENTYELDQTTISTLKQELDKEQKNFHNMVTDYENKLQQLATTIDMEKARSVDLERELERERYMNQKLKHNLENERDSLQESSDREKGIFDEIQMELETEKAKVLDLQRSLDREKKRNNDLFKSIDEEKSSLREELDNERQACRQLKNELDQAQLQKLDITRHYEHERDQLNRVKVERDQTRNDMKIMKERENERERQRDTEKIADKRSARQLERERDDFKMKLHEADLEMQRLKQKILNLEEQVTISKEKEMDIMRDYEQEKLRTLHNQSFEREMSLRNEGSPESDIESTEQRENWKVYKAQLESLCQSLQYQMLQFQDKIGQLVKSDDNEETSAIQNSVKDLLNELRHVQIPLTFESGADRNLMSRPDLNAVNGRILHHNNELTNFVSRLTEEKIELRKTLGRLEEDIWRYRQRDNAVQNGDQTNSHFTDKHLEDKAEWAKERLSLQLSLNDAERQIEQQQHDLKIERDRRSTLPSSGVLSDHDKDKMQRLYGKYLRTESYRKALIYQKKYLLLLLGGFQDCEQTTLALIARMGAFPSPQDMQPRTSHSRLYTIFRSAARVVVAVSRMKFLVNKWKRATRVGSPVVSGTVDSQQGYMPTNRSYSPHARSSSSPHTSINGLYHMSPYLSTTSQRFRTTSSPHPTSLGQMYGSPIVGHDLNFHPSSTHAVNGRTSPYTNGTLPGLNGDLSKDYRSSPSLQTSGARRKILSTPTSSPTVSRDRESPQPQRRVRIVDDQPSLQDSYIERLESLQKKLGSIDSGEEGDISSTEQHNLPEENLRGGSPTLSSISSESSEYCPL